MKEHKMIIRVISDTPNVEAGAFSAALVDAEITAYMADGWSIISTHYLGQIPSEGSVPSFRFIFAWLLGK